MWETWIQSLGQKDTLEKEMVTLFNILAWRIPMDRGGWRATVHGVAKSWARLWDEHFHIHTRVSNRTLCTAAKESKLKALHRVR